MKSGSPLGSLLMSSISTILDLFRALAPVEQSEMMALSPALRIRFANDCSYLASDVDQLASSIQLNSELSAKLAGASERLATVGEQWFDDCLVRLVLLPSGCHLNTSYRTIRSARSLRSSTAQTDSSERATIRSTPYSRVSSITPPKHCRRLLMTGR